MDVTTTGTYICCDVVVLLGPHAFGYSAQAGLGYSKEGGGFSAGFPGWIKVSGSDVTQIDFVINGPAGAQGSKDTLWASYDFSSNTSKGYPIISDVRRMQSPTMDLDDGLYTQVLVWDGDPNIHVSIEKITLDAELEIQTS